MKKINLQKYKMEFMLEGLSLYASPITPQAEELLICIDRKKNTPTTVWRGAR